MKRKEQLGRRRRKGGENGKGLRRKAKRRIEG